MGWFDGRREIQGCGSTVYRQRQQRRGQDRQSGVFPHAGLFDQGEHHEMQDHLRQGEEIVRPLHEDRLRLLIS